MADPAENFSGICTDEAQPKQSPKEKEQASRSRLRWTHVHCFVTGLLVIALAAAGSFIIKTEYFSGSDVNKPEDDITKYLEHFMDEEKKNNIFGNNTEYCEVSVVPANQSRSCKMYQHSLDLFLEPPEQNPSRQNNSTLNNNKDSSLIVHACCISYSRIKAPHQLPLARSDNNKQVVTILQNIHLDGFVFNQYYQFETCRKIPGCTCCKCKCHQTYDVVSAVIVNPDMGPRYKLDFVRVPGCCKCLNT